MFYQNDLSYEEYCRRDVSISGESAVNPLVAIYDIHGRKGKVLFFCSVLDTTQDFQLTILCIRLLKALKSISIMAWYGEKESRLSILALNSYHW
jgi:hypothetical protein